MSELKSKNNTENSDKAYQKKLIQYINKDMSAAEIQQFENEISDDEFVNEAMEGLETISPENISNILTDVNHRLSIELNKKKKSKRRLPLQNLSWIYLAVLIILLMMILSYLIFLYL